jgi:photosystem II stability/assembly factor-like uncharacterized protein
MGNLWNKFPGYIWFDDIWTFDRVTADTIFASVCIDRSQGECSQHIAKSSDGGKSWKDLGDLNGPDIWATNLFFVNDELGWISSSRDDGMYNEIKVPDRITLGMFFKDEKHGRIISGVTHDIYETSDGGMSWHQLTVDEIRDSSFLDYFGSASLDRWNDFAVYRSIIASP